MALPRPQLTPSNCPFTWFFVTGAPTRQLMWLRHAIGWEYFDDF